MLHLMRFDRTKTPEKFFYLTKILPPQITQTRTNLPHDVQFLKNLPTQEP